MNGPLLISQHLYLLTNILFFVGLGFLLRKLLILLPIFSSGGVLKAELLLGEGVGGIGLVAINWWATRRLFTLICGTLIYNNSRPTLVWGVCKAFPA